MLGQLALIRIKGLHGPNKPDRQLLVNVVTVQMGGLYQRPVPADGFVDANSSKNVHDNVTEDWGRDFCRFWAPKKERIGS